MKILNNINNLITKWTGGIANNKAENQELIESLTRTNQKLVCPSGPTEIEDLNKEVSQNYAMTDEVQTQVSKADDILSRNVDNDYKLLEPRLK